MTTSHEKTRMRVVLLEGVHERAVENFARHGYTTIERHRKALAGGELKAAIADAHFVGIRSRTRLTADALAGARKLMTVGAFCIGTNQIDLEAAMMRGIPVFNAPFSNTRSVAELVLAEIVFLMRGIPAKNALLHRGTWLKSADDAREVRGKTLGIVGYGNIGSQLSVMAEALGMEVVYHDVVTRLPLGNARMMPTLDELLLRSDVVTLHVPETPLTQGMMGRAQFARMKAGAFFVNASRGTVVDIEAAAEALERRHLGGAAFDVFPVEPEGNDQEFVSPLRRFDNVILTPHIAGSTVEAQANIGTEVSEKLVRYSDNGSTLSAVNFPEVALPSHPGSHRLLHIHHNVPGVLSRVNGVFSQKRINISGQYLMTNARIGYVVIDVEAASSRLALKALSAIEGTIRARVLF
ncbi:MAG TPA: phosphoglycerate dehydrogenase [Vicinamibacteria bacterium]|nr:phosphoglycerate dehydrogenase [Vicinamibacteria bacterium]